jgi:lipoprotein-anchoring transpeptidase ErfK/SrfK
MKKVRRNRRIVVHREQQVLSLWSRKDENSRWNSVKNYHVSTGMVGLATPAGEYEIVNGSRCPEYQYPDSSWVPVELRGQTFACGDPNNPIVGRWMGLGTKDDAAEKQIAGVGIHGSRDEEDIGTPVSHGCVRMTADAVEDLYNRVGLHTEVEII